MMRHGTIFAHNLRLEHNFGKIIALRLNIHENGTKCDQMRQMAVLKIFFARICKENETEIVCLISVGHGCGRLGYKTVDCVL